MGKLFISYRREDTQDFTGRLYERLADRFGKDNVFMDVDSIPLGTDFRPILRDAIAGSDVVVVIIGRQWLTAKDQRGRRRLDSPDDYVRFEVEEALAHNIPVIPVVTHGMSMPRERDLPRSIASLAYRNGEDVRSDLRFSSDVDVLIARLVLILPGVYPLPDVPSRLFALGFRGVNPNGTAAIIPPLVDVPAGPFLMGSDKAHDPQAKDSETPQRRVEVDAFKIAKYPVTVAEYALAVQAKAVLEPPPNRSVTWVKQLQRLDCPVVCVSWDNAMKYAIWLRSVTNEPNWRLPVVVQWEKAARWDTKRGVSRIYPWGDAFDKNRCNSFESGFRDVRPVGAHPISDARRSGASPYGAEDMAGNISEWMINGYWSVLRMKGSEEEDLTLPETRAVRGGMYDMGAEGLRAACHNSYNWNTVFDSVGFRLVLSGQVPATNDFWK